MTRPRVAHIITRLILGGAQENTLYTVIGQQRDYDVTLIIGIDDGTEGTLRDRAAAANVRLIVVPTLIRPIRPLTDLRALVALVRLLRRERFDVVHTHSSKAGIVGRLAARIAGVPVVVHTLHSLVFHEYQAAWKNFVYIYLKRLCAPITDLLISVNERTTRGALEAGIGRPDQYVTIYSGFELDRFLTIGDRLTPDAAKQRLGIPAAAPVVGKIARLFPLKGHEQFLAAAAEIGRLNPAAWFLIVGDGPIRPEVEQQVAALGLGPRTVFTGRVPPDEVPACIQAMDVVVHTSLREGLARVLPQAGAVGKPIVTFDLDGAPEVVKDGISGYLVAPLDTSALARRAVELLADPVLSRRMGQSGRAFVERTFSVDRMVQLINEQYERLLAARQCPRMADVPR
jgi:glycosyltransferase involved in cell wall biosynthesis